MPSATPKPRTLYDKVTQDHIVNEQDDGTILLYIGMLCFVYTTISIALILGRQASGP